MSEINNKLYWPDPRAHTFIPGIKFIGAHAFPQDEVYLKIETKDTRYILNETEVRELYSTIRDFLYDARRAKHGLTNGSEEEQ